MVRLLAIVATAVAALVTVDATTVDCRKYKLAVGDYCRPQGTAIVSGRVDGTTPFARSPCPALNSMANHGFIPRDGKNLNTTMLLQAATDKFNLAEDLTMLMAGLMPTGTFNLAALSAHNVIEHDVSLTRRDVYTKDDQAIPHEPFVNEVIFLSVVRELSLEDVANIRSARITNCEKSNPECFFGPTQQFIANAESGLLLRGLGGKNSESISYTNVVSFLRDEKFPAGFTRSSTPITVPQILSTSEKLIALQVPPKTVAPAV